MLCLPLADDYGVSPANVTAILHCIDAGSLRGTSLLACGDALEEGVRKLAPHILARPGFLPGIHLNLLEGSCSAPPQSVPQLADERGIFRHSLASLCLALSREKGRQRRDMVEQAGQEWIAQAAKIQCLLREATGLREVPCYVDGHQHVHAIPALRPALEAVLASLPVQRVRVPEETRYYCPAPPLLQLTGFLRRELLASWGRSLRVFLRHKGIACPDYFIGAFCSGGMNMQRLEAGLAAVAKRAGKDALVEIMLHPGPEAVGQSGPADTFSRFYASPARVVESRMLLSDCFRENLAKYDPSWHLS